MGIKPLLFSFFFGSTFSAPQIKGAKISIEEER